ncbi:MAG TPA: FHA domain-containing protein [Ktedonobacterales bacterium]|nr:FHA domain-containing protein [Ktedonobacterales bacterium]
MYTTLEQTSLPVVAAAGLSGPVLVAIGGVVVVLAILLVFIMVLRSNGGARKTASGMGFDAQQGPLGQPRAPMSQPNPGRGRGGAPGGTRQPGGWSPDGDFGAGEAYDGSWGAPAGAGRGQDMWGAQPQQPQFGGAPAGWGEEPNWGGRAPAPGMPGAGMDQNGWGAPQGAPMGSGQDGWGQAAPQGNWGAPPTAPRSWGAPGGAAAGSPLGGPGAASGPANGGAWGGPSAGAPSAAPDWNMPAAAPVGSGYEVDKTRVVRPAGAQRLATLVVRQGKEPGRVYELRKDRTTIGRSRESDIFLEDLAVSRLHSTINRDDGGRYYLRDENSANGTVLNGQRVGEQELQEGDEIQVGQTVLAFVHR